MKRDLLIRIEQAGKLLDPKWLIVRQETDVQRKLESILGNMTEIKQTLNEEDDILKQSPMPRRRNDPVLSTNNKALILNIDDETESLIRGET